ncbi:glycosyltransferase [Nocardia huaxiensis]|uniref:Glycosyltransferase n=1 Tax=Nocardia huaxiensis TaxID=2755382 RepID=A0A7D6VEM7_9NOCA|nr:glycosyltransferase family 2 protein [Nocardia huaxiensis]QLY33611.1 glycosyltransferase [Nocardia huaxiensis]UFS99472.1 glycosyltransferase [Nocardia huaxiensis]
MTPSRARATAARAGTTLTHLGTGLATLGTLVALANRLSLRQLKPTDQTVTEPVTVCIPARNEADRLPALIADLRAQQGIPRLRVLILDDASTDETSAAAREAIAGDKRFTLSHNDIDPPPGWNGKTAACWRLAELAGIRTSAIPETACPGAPATPAASRPGTPGTGALIFLDADVRITPHALATAVQELRRTRAALLCPWPLQRAGSAGEYLVQPLLCWSWASTLPIPLANRSLRPSTAVACGQFLVFDAATYSAVGGHAAVADHVTEDLAIARELRRSGHHTELAGAGRLAETRMYRGATELEAGYTRWLWSAYGGPAGSAAVASTAALAYWVPPLAAIFGRGRVRRIGLIGYAAAVSARILARSTESGKLPGVAEVTAALAHPVSIAAYLRLSALSHRAHRAGALSWKGRGLNSNRACPVAVPLMALE